MLWAYAFSGLIFLSGLLVYPLRELGLMQFGSWPAFAHAFFIAAIWSLPDKGRLGAWSGFGLISLALFFETMQHPVIWQNLPANWPFLSYGVFGVFDPFDVLLTILGFLAWSACSAVTRMAHSAQTSGTQT